MAAGRNAGLLGTSVMMTAGVGLLMELYLAGALGGERYGRIAFARSLAEVALVGASFGLDTYARREVAKRPSHASEFYGGFLAARAFVTLFGVGVIAALLIATGKPHETVVLAALFGTAQFFIHSSRSAASILQAVGAVREAAALSIVTKLVWVLVVVGGTVAGLGLLVIPVAWIITEAANTVALTHFARRHVQLTISLRNQTVRPILAASAPFLVLQLSGSLFMNLDVTLVGFLTNDTEVGIYRSAMNLALPVLILAPVIQQVLVPLASRAAARSVDELAIVTRRSLEITAGLAIPVALLMALNADTAFGLAFADNQAGVYALRLLSLTVVATYVNMVVGTFLTVTNHGWVLTRAVLFGVGLDAAMNLVLIRVGQRWWGEGGAGMGAAISFITAETAVMVLLVGAVGRHALDRRNIRTIASVVVMGVFVVIFDRLTKPALGGWRAVTDTAVYGVHIWAMRIVDPKIVRRWLHRAVRRHRNASKHRPAGTGAQRKEQDHS